MRCAIELSDIHHVILVLEHCGFVVVDIEVVRCAEDGHNTRESCCSCLPIHTISSVLCFMGSDDR